MNEKEKDFVKFLKKDKSYSSKLIDDIHTKNLYKKTKLLSFKSTVHLSYAFPVSFLIGNESINPDTFIKSIRPKNTETVFLALNAAYALNREDIIFEILHRYKHMEILFYLKDNPCLLNTALTHSSKRIVQSLLFRMKSFNLITSHRVSNALRYCLAHSNMLRFNWLLEESGFSLDELMTVRYGYLFKSICSVKSFAVLQEIFSQIGTCDHLFARDDYNCFINVFWNKNKLCRDFLVKKGFDVIRKSISLGNYTIIHFSSDKKCNNFIRKVLNLYQDKAKEIIASKDFYIVQKAILTDNIELILILLHHYKGLLGDLLKRDPSQFEFGLSLNSKLKTLSFLEELRPNVVRDLFVVDQYKSIYRLMRMKKNYHVQQIVSRFSIPVEELIKANNYEIIIHIALSNNRRLIKFLNSSLCGVKKYRASTLYINFQRLFSLSYLYPPSGITNFLKRYPMWAKRNLEQENYKSINTFFSCRWGDITSDEFLNAFSELIELSGKSLHEILTHTNYEIIKHIRYDKLFEFIFSKLSNEEQDLLIKKCLKTLLDSALSSNDSSMINFLQNNVPDDEIISMLRKDEYFLVKSNIFFNHFSAIEALLQIAPNIISEALDKIGAKFLFHPFFHPGTIETVESILLITKRSFDSYTNDDSFFEAFVSSCLFDHETTSYLLAKCPSKHKEMISFDGFRAVHNCIEEYHPDILELLFESQYELIDNNCDVVLISRITQVIKFFDCENKPDLGFRMPYIEIPATRDVVIELITKCFKYNLFLIAKFLCSHIKTNRKIVYYLVGECVLISKKFNDAFFEFINYALSLLPYLEKERLLQNKLVKNLPSPVREKIENL